MAMLKNPGIKYRPFPQVDLPDRQWPSRTITKAPRWLSTDMRDGNQSLIDPMDADKKARFFDLLVKVGLKEIEVGFPSAGATEYDFIRGLVDQGRIPDDVMVQVLTQSREDLIKTSFESLAGAKQAIVHVYNAVSPLWRSVVFGMEKSEIRKSPVAAPPCCATRPPASRRPTGTSNIAPRPSRPPNSISASNAARR
jgi:2-isopropylmalate synthase